MTAPYTYDTGTDKDVAPEEAREFFAAVATGGQERVAETLARYPNAVHWRRHLTDESEADNEDEDALHLACNKGQLEIAVLLLDAHAPMETHSWGSLNITPLVAAICGKHAALVDLLLERGADPVSALPEGSPPLSYACEIRHPGIAGALLKHGASPDALNCNGVPPLNLAADMGSRELLKLLLEWGANPALTDEAGRNAIEAARTSTHPDMAAFFMQRNDERIAAQKETLAQAFNRAVDEMISAGTPEPLAVRHPLKLKARM